MDEITYDRSVWIGAPREAVFEYFTDPEKLTRWMGSAAQLEPQVGGIFRVDMNGRDIARGEFVELDPPGRVVFTFGWEAGGAPVRPGGSTVEVTLVPEGNGTSVRLVHRGLAQPLLASHAEGWDHHIDRLVIVAAGGDPGPDPRAKTVIDGALSD
ncbi:MAG TPA: SRPBCC family protein [Acidimicrobiales bacterium]|nr:SRPBCC family protein [Acidimicrobiales bacterium]